MNSLKIEIQNVLAMAAALEREPVKPGENEVSDRMERRYQIQARFDALLVEACARRHAIRSMDLRRLAPRDDRWPEDSPLRRTLRPFGTWGYYNGTARALVRKRVNCGRPESLLTAFAKPSRRVQLGSRADHCQNTTASVFHTVPRRLRAHGHTHGHCVIQTGPARLSRQ
jgi:hypothetical protein